MLDSKVIFFLLIPPDSLPGLFPHLPRHLLTEFRKLHNDWAAPGTAIFNHMDFLLPGTLTAQGPLVTYDCQLDPLIPGLSLVATLFKNRERSVSYGTFLRCVRT